MAMFINLFTKIMYSHKLLTIIPNQERSRYLDRLRIIINY
jgi:hypothetical protein